MRILNFFAIGQYTINIPEILELCIIFQETDQLVVDFSLDYGDRELPLKNIF